jgi:hypothetical protein
MRIYIKTSEVTFEFEDHVEAADYSYARHTLPSNQNDFIKGVIENVLKLHQEIYKIEKESDL